MADIKKVIEDLKDEGKFGGQTSRPVTRGELAEVVEALVDYVVGTAQ